MEAGCCCAIVTGLSPDSARDENNGANVAASKKVSRNSALNRFMIYSFFCASVVDFIFRTDTEPQQTLCDFGVRSDIA